MRAVRIVSWFFLVVAIVLALAPLVEVASLLPPWLDHARLTGDYGPAVQSLASSLPYVALMYLGLTLPILGCLALFAVLRVLEGLYRTSPKRQEQ